MKTPKQKTPKRKTPSARIEAHYDKACAIAEKEVERLARAILKRHPSLKEFVMGMGIWGFWDKNDNSVDADDRRVRSLARFISKWDRFLYLSGSPMRFTADGPVVTYW